MRGLDVAEPALIVVRVNNDVPRSDDDTSSPATPMPTPGRGDVVFECQACQHRFLVPSAALRIPDSTAASDNLGDLLLTAFVASGYKDEAAQAAVFTGHSVRAAAARAEEAADQRQAAAERLRYTQCPLCRSGSSVPYISPEDRARFEEMQRRRRLAELKEFERRREEVRDRERHREERRIRRAALLKARRTHSWHSLQRWRSWMPTAVASLSLLLLVAGVGAPWVAIAVRNPPPYLIIGAPAFWGWERIGALLVAALAVSLDIRSTLRGLDGTGLHQLRRFALVALTAGLAVLSVRERVQLPANYLSLVAVEVNREFASAGLTSRWGSIASRELLLLFPGQALVFTAAFASFMAVVLSRLGPRAIESSQVSEHEAPGGRHLSRRRFAWTLATGVAGLLLGGLTYVAGKTYPEFGQYPGALLSGLGLVACLAALSLGFSEERQT